MDIPTHAESSSQDSQAAAEDICSMRDAHSHLKGAVFPTRGLASPKLVMNQEKFEPEQIAVRESLAVKVTIEVCGCKARRRHQGGWIHELLACTKLQPSVGSGVTAQTGAAASARAV